MKTFISGCYEMTYCRFISNIKNLSAFKTRNYRLLVHDKDPNALCHKVTTQQAPELFQIMQESYEAFCLQDSVAIKLRIFSTTQVKKSIK